MDRMLPHDLDDIYGPGAEDANIQADVDLENAALDLYNALIDLRDLYISATEATDTYCEFCETHAYKYVDERGEWTGQVDPIVHKPNCILGKVERAIAKAEGESRKC